MQTVMRLIAVMLVVLACVGCIYGRKRKPGTNIGTGSADHGGPWTQGESGGGPALTDRDR